MPFSYPIVHVFVCKFLGFHTFMAFFLPVMNGTIPVNIVVNISILLQITSMNIFQISVSHWIRNFTYRIRGLKDITKLESCSVFQGFARG